MRTRFVIAVSAALLGTIAMFGFVEATPIAGVTSTLIAVGRFDDIDAKTLTDIDPGPGTEDWQARIKTKGSSDLYVLENRIAPGGTFGWHSHPGPSLVIVKSGALTLYLAADPTCMPRTVGAGTGFVDNGGDVHLVRNEGSVETVVYVTSLIPTGFARRVDEPAPGTCSF